MLLRCRDLRYAIRSFQRPIRNDETITPSVDTPAPRFEDYTTDDDRDEVDALVDFLQLPYELTKRLEGNNSTSGFGSL